MLYQRVQLSTSTNVGASAPLPDDLFGLENESLADIEAAVGHDAAAQLGYLDTGFFPAPELPVVPPNIVTNSAFRMAASDAGKLDDIDAGIAALGDPNATIAWQYNSVFDLNAAPSFLHLAGLQVGLDDAELAALFAAGRSKPQL